MCKFTRFADRIRQERQAIEGRGKMGKRGAGHSSTKSENHSNSFTNHVIDTDRKNGIAGKVNHRPTIFRANGLAREQGTDYMSSTGIAWIRVAAVLTFCATSCRKSVFFAERVA